MEGLTSFSLQAGLPQFLTGKLEALDVAEGGGSAYRLSGAPGFRYLVERQQNGSDWLPWQVLTNSTGTVDFTDSEVSSSIQIYRARLLD